MVYIGAALVYSILISKEQRRRDKQMQTTTIETKMIDDAIYETDDSISVHQSYSGRGMHGDTCFGLVGGQRAMLKFFVALAQEDPELANDLADSLCTDNMGRDYIYYFPGFQLNKDSIRQSGWDD